MTADPMPVGATGWRQWTAVAVALALATALLHGSAVSGGWFYDDAPQLRFAATYSPWQYFFIPEVMRQQSYAHITPFNSMFYDLGLPLFGLNAAGHHVHLLLVLWLAAMSTWFLLRTPVGAGPALAGALMLLAMPPTGVVARMLMTGHYAYGLLFSVLALAAFSHAVRRDSAAWAVVAAGWYALACLSKELYVPLLLVFAAWPGLTWRRRLRLTAALGVVGAAYAFWRLHVLGGVGGYAALAAGPGTLRLDPQSLIDGLNALRADLVGRGAPGWLALALVAAVVLAARSSERKPRPVFLLACTAALLVPVLPLLLFNFPLGFARAAILIGFGVTVGVAWQLSRLRGRLVQGGLSLALIGLLAFGQRHAIDDAAAAQRAVAAANRFLIQANATEVLVAEGLGDVGYLQSMREAVLAVEGRVAPRVIEDDDDLVALGPTLGGAAWAWQPECNCLQRLGDAFTLRVAAIRSSWAAGTYLALRVQAQVDDAGRVKIFRWHFNGSPGRHRVEVRHMARLDLPASGTLAFGLDTTFRPPEPALLRFSVIDDDGSIQRSPWLPLSLSKGGTLRWDSEDDRPSAVE